MKLTRCKKIFLIIALTAFVVLLFSSNTAFAAINTEYSDIDPVSSTYLNEAIEDSGLIGMLARLIYAVGRLLEWILGTIFKMLTGSSDFPWADKIVFNAVPLLEVNFINPGGSAELAKQTFVGQTAIQNVLQDLYATILTLAITFFGIVVWVTAIKLVISTIASDKAKYKQAIVDWCVGFLMLFCIHYGISFIFYLNEQLVVTASKLVTERLKDANVQANVELGTLSRNIVDAARASGATYAGKSVADILEENPQIVQAWLNKVGGEENEHGIMKALMLEKNFWGLYKKEIEKKEQYKLMGMMVYWAASENVSVTELENIRYNELKVYSTPDLDLCNGTWLGAQFYTWSSGTGASKKTFYGNAQALNASTFYQTIFGGLPDNGSFTIRNAMSLFYLHGADFYSKYNLLLPSPMEVEYKTNVINTNVYIIDIIEGKIYYNNKNGNLKNVKYEVTPPLEYNANDAQGYMLSAGASQLERIKNSPNLKNFKDGQNSHVYKASTDWYWSDVIEDLIALKSASKTANVTEHTGVYVPEGANSSQNGRHLRLIADLGTYFKYNAYEKTVDDKLVTTVVDSDNAKIQNMIMYAILVAQSLILFISYVKRLFYVILLAMMAPIVVVFDFFQKFGK